MLTVEATENLSYIMVAVITMVEELELKVIWIIRCWLWYWKESDIFSPSPTQWYHLWLFYNCKSSISRANGRREDMGHSPCIQILKCQDNKWACIDQLRLCRKGRVCVHHSPGFAQSHLCTCKGVLPHIDSFPLMGSMLPCDWLVTCPECTPELCLKRAGIGSSRSLWPPWP